MKIKHLSFGVEKLFFKQLYPNMPAQRRARYFWVMASLGLATSLPLWVANVPAIASPETRQKLAPNQQIAQNSEQAPASSQMNQLFVNPTSGNDSTGNGSNGTPFKTITQALRVAGPNTIIVLAPGVYSAESGETFPLELKSDITIQGDPPNKGNNIIIRGGGLFISPTFARQNIAILAADKSAITGVTITNPNRRGYGLWIESSSPTVADNTFTSNSHDGISVTGDGAPIIRNNYFANNGANGITIFNNARPEVRANVFENTGFGINIAHNATPLLIDNRIIQNTDGIVVQGKAQPILRNNTIERNTRDGLVAIRQAKPDLGSSGQPGGNIFRNNGRFEINSSAATEIIPAFGNEIARSRINGRLDLGGTITNSTQIATSSTNVPTNSVAIPVVPARSNVSRSTTRSTTAARRRTTRRSRTGARRSRQSRNTRAIRVTPPFNNQINPVAISAPPTVPAPSNVIPSLSLPSQRQNETPLALTRQNETPLPSQRQNETPLALQRQNQTPLPSQRQNQTQVNLNTELPIRQGRSTLPTPGIEPGLLPVPGSEIPVGHTGNMVSLPTVDVSQSNPRQRRNIVSNVPSVSSRAIALGMRYRVVVDLDNPGQLRLVRSLVPKAFRVRSNGRLIMQVGAYSDRTQAEEMLQRMTSNGLNASLEEL